MKCIELTSYGHPFWLIFCKEVGWDNHEAEERENKDRCDLQTAEEDCPPRSCMVYEQTFRKD
jgi:hypothetical protein